METRMIWWLPLLKDGETPGEWQADLWALRKHRTCGANISAPFILISTIEAVSFHHLSIQSTCKGFSKRSQFLFWFSDLWDATYAQSYLRGRQSALPAAAKHRWQSQVWLRSCSVTRAREAICVQVLQPGLTRRMVGGATWPFLSQIPLSIWLYLRTHSSEKCLQLPPHLCPFDNSFTKIRPSLSASGGRDTTDVLKWGWSPLR